MDLIQRSSYSSGPGISITRTRSTALVCTGPRGLKEGIRSNSECEEREEESLARRGTE